MTLEEWVEHHRLEGHHPHPVPTHDNPEKWECDCGNVTRICHSLSNLLRPSPMTRLPI
jgi:hypothetical protein